jgi:hypothetical protein
MMIPPAGSLKRTPASPLSELGTWNGMVFDFFKPFTLADGTKTMHVDCTLAELPPGMDLDTVMLGFTEPAAMMDEYDDGLRGQNFTVRRPGN